MVLESHVLKETELRVHFTQGLRTVGAREVLDADVLQRRLLLCLYGLGTNVDLAPEMRTP